MDGKVKEVRIKSGEVYFIGSNNKMYFAKKGEIHNGNCLVYEKINNKWKHIANIGFEGTKVTAQRIWEALQL